MTGPAVVMCADPLHPGRVDAHFAAEAAAVRGLGGRVVRLDHDALQAGDAEGAVRAVPAGLGPCWYRGWMVTADEYAALDEALRGRGAHLLTRPEDYRRAHELPGWYPAFEAVSPSSVWMPCLPGAAPGEDVLAALVAPLRGGAAVVKDFVKSRKHEWREACFVPDIADTARLRGVVARMVELQAEFLTGGVVVREYLRLTGPEVRVWWRDAEPVLVGPHPDDPDAVVPDPRLEPVAACVAALGCRFVTTDLAQRADGDWIVVEVGDGQVSDLPASVDPAALHAALPAR